MSIVTLDTLDFIYGSTDRDVETKIARPKDSKNPRNLEKLRERGGNVYTNVMAKIAAAQTRIRTCGAYKEIGRDCMSNYV